MSKKLKRFVWNDIEVNGLMRQTAVIVDTQTGVNYLLASFGEGSGLSPLLDENGRPIVTKNIVTD